MCCLISHCFMLWWHQDRRRHQDISSAIQIEQESDVRGGKKGEKRNKCENGKVAFEASVCRHLWLPSVGICSFQPPEFQIAWIKLFSFDSLIIHHNSPDPARANGKLSQGSQSSGGVSLQIRWERGCKKESSFVLKVCRLKDNQTIDWLHNNWEGQFN